MLEESANDQMVVGMGQKENAKANSPIIRLKIKLWIKVALDILSSIEIVQRICKIKGKLIKPTTKPFHKKIRLKACTTLNIKNAESSVNKKAAVEAALYKGIVLMAATLNTFCESSRR